MKNKFLNILLSLTIISLISCQQKRVEEASEKSYHFQKVADQVSGDISKNVYIMTIDSCEYIVWQGSHGDVGFTHKGNCKFH